MKILEDSFGCKIYKEDITGVAWHQEKVTVFYCKPSGEYGGSICFKPSIWKRFLLKRIAKKFDQRYE